MSFVDEALTWFAITFMLGLALGCVALAVAVAVGKCRGGAPAPTELARTELAPVPWTMAVEVTNPDDTKIMAVRDPA